MTRPPFDEGHLTGPEHTSAGAVVIPKPGLPGALISRRPELADAGVGAYVVTAAVAA